MTTVHLLLHDLDADRTSEEELDSLLDDAERRRAERFVQPVHRRRFRVGRAMLRRTLSSWTGVPAAHIKLEYGANGKPTMQRGPAFNVSHSEQALLIGVADSATLGVDVEVLRPIHDRLMLAKAHFAREEIEALQREPAEAQDEAFLRIWTCKEAFIKAIGDGLGIPLRSFTVCPRVVGGCLKKIELESLGSTAEWDVRCIPAVAVNRAAVVGVAIKARTCEVAWLPKQ